MKFLAKAVIPTNQYQEAKIMSKNIKKEIKATPFFARFLEAQQEQSNQAPFQTLKYPSDWEEF